MTHHESGIDFPAMADSMETPTDDSPWRVGQVGLIGLLLFGAAGTLEAAFWCGQVDYPEASILFRRTVLVYLALGGVLGLLWGFACESTVCRRFDLERGRFYGGSLGVLLLTLLAVVYTHLYLLDPTVRVTSAVSLLVAGSQLALGAALIAGILVRSRKHSRSPSRVLKKPHLAIALAIAFMLLAFGVPEVARRWQAPDSEPVRPNVLLIVLDTTRFDRLSTYGYPLETTPALSRLATEGVVFTRAYSAAPWTLHAHASIFTGAYPAQHGATSEHKNLAKELPTLAERVGKRGLRTVAISLKSWLSHETGILRGFDQVFDLLRQQRLPVLLEVHDFLSRKIRREGDKGARAVTHCARKWLGRHGDRPFFMFVNYNEAHTELSPPEPFRRKYLKDQSDTRWGIDRSFDMVRFDLGQVTLTELDIEILSRLYDASLEYQDWRMGQLIDALRDHNLLDETLIIVTSDHGENLGDHGLMGHNMSMADTLLHVPLVVRYPRRLPRGLHIDQPVETRRIGTLIQALLGHGSPKSHLGAEELVEALSGRNDGAVISEAFKPFVGGFAREDLPSDSVYHRRRKSLILGDHKYVWSSDGAHELYDLNRDPGELSNLVEERPGVTERLGTLLAEDEFLFQEAERNELPRLSQEMVERLRAVGYLE